MFKFKTIQQQLIEERILRNKLQVELDKQSANMDYIAMMTDVELNTEVQETNEPIEENTEEEVSNE